MTLLRMLLACSVSLIAIALPLQAQGPFSRVEIVAEPRLGGALLELRCSLTPIWSSWKNPYQNNCVFTKVGYGTYILRVEAPGFEPHRQVVPVFQSEVFVRAGIAIGEIRQFVGHRPYYSIVGTIDPALDPENHWLRLVDLHGNSGWIFDSKLTKKGRFRFTTSRPGQSLLLVLRKSDGKVEVIHTQAMEVSEFGDTKFSIVLDSASAQ